MEGDEITLYGDEGPVRTIGGPSRASRTECSECGRSIAVMAFKGTGVCSEDCRKKRDGEA